MNTGTLLLLTAIAALPSCNGEGAAQQAVVGPDAGLETLAGEPTPYRKPGAAIYLVNRGVPQLAPGQVQSVELVLRAGYSEGTMSVTVAASEGLEILGAEVTSRYQLSAGEDYRLPLQLLAERSGRYYLDLSVAVQMPDGSSVARAIGYAVQVGVDQRGNQKAVAPAAAESGGVISLPAEETVRQ